MVLRNSREEGSFRAETDLCNRKWSYFKNQYDKLNYNKNITRFDPDTVNLEIPFAVSFDYFRIKNPELE